MADLRKVELKTIFAWKLTRGKQIDKPTFTWTLCTTTTLSPPPPLSLSLSLSSSFILSYLNAVVGLLVDDGDVLPAEPEDDLGHGERLVVVAGDGAREVLEALLVRQLGTRREEGDLKEGRSG